jgi:von Willebrand factor type A domain
MAGNGRIRAAVIVLLCLAIAGAAGTYAFVRHPRYKANAVSASPQAPDRASTGRPPGQPGNPSGAPPQFAARHADASSTPDPTGPDLALDDNGGAVESITGEYGGGADGGRLIDGTSDPVWAWRGSALRDLPLEIVLSFYRREPALVTAVVIDMPPLEPSGAPNGNAPKDVEIWTSMDSADAGFAKVGAATLTGPAPAQTVSFPSAEARYVKIRVLSVQGPIWALSRVDIGSLHVLEAQHAGYNSLSARNADLADWKNSPRHAAQRGIDWLQPAAIAWQKDHNCFGCHIQAQAVMGLAIAKKNDYRVNDRTLKELVDFTVSQQHADGSYVREDAGEPSTQFAAMQLAYWDDLQGIGRNPSLIKSVDWLAARQKPAGHFPYNDWLTCGVRAVEQGSLMTTANTLVAFERAFVETHDTRYRDAADRARAWIASTEAVTTQDKVFRILAIARYGGAERRPLVERVVDQLIVEQHPTGGWRECNDPSTKDPNPFSTGQVLYAFKQAGVSVNASPFIRGVKYLLATQNGDGSWPADSHAFHTSGAPHAASMWAIIGLAGSFGTVKTGQLQITTDLRPERAAARRNLEIILDLSGSMKQSLGASTRVETARRTLHDVLAKIPDDFNVGLRVYAHRYSARQKETCTDTELVSPIAPLDRRRILSIADRLQPRGETPLVHSILQAPGDLKAVGGGSVIVITDGEETCGGDPVDAAQQLKAAGLPLTLNIVGFTLNGKKVEQDLTAFAEATGGHYYSAQDGDALGRAITRAALTRIPYVVYDNRGSEVAKGTTGPLADDLPPGRYTVVVQAGDQTLTENVDVAVGTSVVLQVAQRDGRFQLLREPK